MVENITSNNWTSNGSTVGTKTNASSQVENEALNDAAAEKSVSEGKSTYGEAATLELSQDYVNSNGITTSMVYANRAAQRTLKVGCSGSDVKELQTNLRDLGYTGVGTPDGKFGNNTKNAVISFQKTYGLTPDGIAGANTLNAVNTAISRQKNNILSKGQVSENVKNLQKDLISLGFLSGKPDGAYGKNTENAVIAFQKKFSLSQTGYVTRATRDRIAQEVKNQNNPKPPVNPTPVGPTPSTGSYSPISNGQVMSTPAPGTKITVSVGTDKPNIQAEVTKTNCWTIEYSIAGCHKAYPNATCTKRLDSACEKFSYNKGQNDLLQFDVPGLGKCFAGAMVEGFGNIGDIAEITLDDGTKFNFMLLDAKSTKHKSSELSPNNQCQNQWGHGYMLSNNSKVQLSICEFITSQSESGKSSAKNYPSGSFLDGRYVASAKIVGHANIEG